MKTFLDWANSQKLELPLLTEKAARAGFNYHAYPDLYIRTHYPDGWFMPRAADNLFKLADHHPFHVKHDAMNQMPKEN